METKLTLTTGQCQALASFMTGRGEAGKLTMGRTGCMTQAEAKPLIKKGLLHAEFKTLQCGVKEFRLTEAGKEAFSRLRIARGTTFMEEER